MNSPLLLGFAAGALISLFTTPIGVSGAVFLPPVQLSVLGVPSPVATATNLMFNVITGPGALLRYRIGGQLAWRSLTAAPGPAWSTGNLVHWQPAARRSPGLDQNHSVSEC